MVLDKQNSIYLYNSLTNKKELFIPITRGNVSIYTCGPTVYDTPHIGNYRSYIFSDILVRTFLFNKYKVKYIINITDVGHLTDERDQGEDKLEKRALEEKKEARGIAKVYTNQFLAESCALNLKEANEYPKATEHIKEQVEMIKSLEKKGFTYKIDDGIYFDTGKLNHYGYLSKATEKEDARARIKENHQKKNMHDFALWKFSPKAPQRQMEWSSPWGVGFPGWHIECSAMSHAYLGFPFDIHTGGIDHKQVHHENEIAQNKIFFSGKSVNYWLHNNFVTIEGNKMSKSIGNLYTISNIKQKGFTPLALRYLYLSTQYRQILEFSWGSLSQAQSAYTNLAQHIERLSSVSSVTLKFILNFFKYSSVKKHWINKFKNAIGDDLNTPRALAVVWELIKNENIGARIKLYLLLEFDKVLGLGLAQYAKAIPENIKKIAIERQRYRIEKNWKKSDELRKEIEKHGFIIEDIGESFRIIKKV